MKNNIEKDSFLSEIKERQKCVVKGCTNQRLAGCSYCLFHYDDHKLEQELKEGKDYND